jgi:replicative DNA helicase
VLTPGGTADAGHPVSGKPNDIWKSSMERLLASSAVCNGEQRLPPHDGAAERALLSIMLQDATVIAEAVGLIHGNDFYVFAHGIIFRVMVKLQAGGKPVDIVTVPDALSPAQMEEIGGPTYLVDLCSAAPSATHWKQYVEIIREQAQRRRIIQAARDFETRAFDPTNASADLLAEAERRIVEIANVGSGAGYRFVPMDSKDFAAKNFRPSWIINHVLVKGQPSILGGPKKAMKTSLLIDLALSIGSGTLFLNHFTVHEKLRVALISGESGPHTIQETARLVALAKNIDLTTANVLWDFRVPQLASEIELAELGRGLRRFGAEVVIVDPLYLMLLAGQGGQGLQASNLYDMGPLLLHVSQVCLDAGATPILAHHAKRGRTTGAYEPLDLDDLAFSGIAEFARQWILVSRRESYEIGSGFHRLWFSAGGSLGHSGLWALDVDEGPLAEDFGGRRWGVTVTTAGDSRAADKEAREDQRAQKQRESDKADDVELLLALDRLDPQRQGAGYTKAGDIAKLKGGRMTRAVQRLKDEGIVEELPVVVIVGNRAKRTVRGIRRRTSEHPNGTSTQSFGCSGTSS